MLSDSTIMSLSIEKGLVTPFNSDQLQPASYDLTLGDEILRYNGCGTIDLANRKLVKSDDPRFGDYKFGFESVKIGSDGYILQPDAFILASTREVVNLPDDVCGRFEGKSSLGRFGLTTHITAGFIDPGFEGEITLELKNETRNRMILRTGMKIGQICFFKMDSKVDRPYGNSSLGSHYKGQRGPTSPLKE